MSDDFTGDNWKTYLSLVSFPVPSYGPGANFETNYGLIRKKDGVPIAHGIPSHEEAIKLAKRLTIKLEKELENILLNSESTSQHVRD